jgi:hypothetical protein
MTAIERWAPGQIITRREVLGFDPVPAATPSASWAGRCWLEVPVRVVEDSDEAFVVYLEPGAPFTFPPGDWPTRNGRHPWHGRTGWHGHGCLMVHRPGDHHAVWHFWQGEQRAFACWYVNLQTAFRRVGDAFETQDLELDLVVAPDGSWAMKDWDLLDERAAEGRYSTDLIAWIRALGTKLGRELDAGRSWWDASWRDWSPDRIEHESCVSCGSPSASARDTTEGRVLLCGACVALHDLGCP